jgi:hypothetical protein
MSDNTTSLKKDWSFLFSIPFRIILSIIISNLLGFTSNGFDFFDYDEEERAYSRMASYFMETVLPLIVTYLALLNAFVPPKGLITDPIAKNHFFKETYLLLGLTGLIPLVLTVFGGHINHESFDGSFGVSFELLDYLWVMSFWSLLLFYCLSVIRNFVFLYHIHYNAWGSSE